MPGAIAFVFQSEARQSSRKDSPARPKRGPKTWIPAPDKCISGVTILRGNDKVGHPRSSPFLCG